MSKKTQKNRRCRDAKFSEYKLRQMVMCFAKGMTAADTAKQIKMSEPTIRNRFMQLRQLLYDHGPMRMAEPEGAKDRPARYIYGRTYRGAKEEYAHLYEMETLNRIFATKNVNSVTRYDAGDADQMKIVMKFIRYNQRLEKYDITEMLYDASKNDAEREKRSFELADYKSNSTIIVNERNIDPVESFFRVIWTLLLKHPL